MIENKKDFRIVFRTFGKDIDMIIKELNLLFFNKHPYYNSNQNLSKYEIKHENKYKIHRDKKIKKTILKGMDFLTPL